MLNNDNNSRRSRSRSRSRSSGGCNQRYFDSRLSQFRQSILSNSNNNRSNEDQAQDQGDEDAQRNDVPLSAEISACLRCNLSDQILALDRVNCLCSLANQQNQYQSNHHHHQLLLQQQQQPQPQAYFRVEPFVSCPSQSMRFENPHQLHRYISQCRKWISVWNPPAPSIASRPRIQFSLTTYNILSQNLLLNHMYLYRGNVRSDLAWNDRAERLKRELLELNSDIFCLQEVHIENFRNAILPALHAHGYDAVFKRKTGEQLDGCSILFKRDKFRLQDSREIEFNRPNISRLLDKDNVGLLVRLRPIGTKQCETINANNDNNDNDDLVVANTHLLFNPKRGDIKLAQLRLLLAEIQRFALRDPRLIEPGGIGENGSSSSSSSPSPSSPSSSSAIKIVGDPCAQSNYSPVIICGDMNSEPQSPLIEFITQGELCVDGLMSGDLSGQREGAKRGRRLSAQDLRMRGIGANSCFEFNDTVDDDRTNDCSIQCATNGDDDRCDDSMTVQHVFRLKSSYPMVDEHSDRLVSMATYLDCGMVDHIFYSFKHRDLRLSAFRQLFNQRMIENIGQLPNAILGSDHVALSAKFYLFCNNQ